MEITPLNKRIAAFAAAVLIAASCLAGCQSKNNGNDEPTFNTIENGTVAPSPEETDPAQTDVTAVTDPDGNIVTDEQGNEVTTTTATFKDPSAMITDASVPMDDDYFLTQEPTGTTVNEADIIAMIEAGTTAAPVEKPPVMKEYNIDVSQRYGYNQLSNAEKQLYKDMLDCVKSCKTKMAVDDSISNEMWIKVYGCMYTQEPELFWIANRAERGRFWYWETDPDIIAKLQKEVDAGAAKVLGQAEGLDTYGKVKTFHDYIALHNTFELYDPDRIEETCYNFTIYGGLVKGTIQCEGYAKTMQYLCDLADIESMVVIGTNEKGDSHAWNVIKIDGSWYNVDTTWDDPILSEPVPTNLRHIYFGVPDEWIHNKSHFNINTKTTGTKVKYFDPPKCTSDAMNWFAKENKLYGDKESADTALRAALKIAADGKTRVAEIRVKDKATFDAIKADLKTYAQWIKDENSAVKGVS
ncbi:MAG: hypothetical protein IKR73_06930, partial [Oscillospiraceae bacterium]|nr:hypothetical protein [Oscillospiraceae bacterium]